MLPCISEARRPPAILRSSTLPRPLLLAGVLSAMGLFFSCTSERRSQDETPVYREGVDELLRARCASCHAGLAPAAGWRADTFLGAIGCTASGKPATLGAEAPVLLALDRPDHAGLLSAQERSTLLRWLAAGAPGFRSGVHEAAFVDPRSPGSHGRFLRARSYRPMLEAQDVDACGRCHEEAPSRPPAVSSPAPGATSCTTCHGEPSGPLGCATCHGAAGRSHPPRDACFFPGDPGGLAHAAHSGPSPSRAEGLACATCHPTPTSGQPGGTHATGYVDVWFDHGIAGREARLDPGSKRCAVACHARGGARPAPAWSDGPMGCGDCHASPPAGHYGGECTGCHREADARGTALVLPRLHMNGKVDLGDGSGTCGACHGRGEDPWPSTAAHLAHARPRSARPVACETCHEVPGPGDRHPRGEGVASVRLSGLATRGGRRATWDTATKTCAGTYCHEGAGGSRTAPRWTDGAPASACGTCHGTPPPPSHPPGTQCSSSGCHEGSTTTAGAITPAGKPVHVDGLLQRSVP